LRPRGFTDETYPVLKGFNENHRTGALISIPPLVDTCGTNPQLGKVLS